MGAYAFAHFWLYFVHIVALSCMLWRLNSYLKGGGGEGGNSPLCVIFRLRLTLIYSNHLQPADNTENKPKERVRLIG